MKGIHQRQHQLLERAAERQAADQRGKFEIDRQRDPATVRTQRDKLPGTVQLLERAIGQPHFDMVIRAPLVDGGEGLLERGLGQRQFGAHAVGAAIEHFGGGTAGQKLRVTLDIIDQREHLFGAVRHNRFPVDTRHNGGEKGSERAANASTALPFPARVAIMATL